MKGILGRSKRVWSLLLVFTLVISMLAQVQVAKAAGVSAMSDEDFFGKYSIGTWWKAGVLNYDYPGMAPIKELVKSGDYEGAKTALHTYYKQRDNFFHLQEPERRQKEVPIYLDNIFTLGLNRYVGSWIFNSSWQWKTVDVTDLITEEDIGDGKISFILMARNKNQGDAEISTRESSNKPVMELTKSSGEVVVVQAQKDTYVNGDDRYRNYGSETVMRIKDVGDPKNGHVKKGYLTFPFDVEWDEVTKIDLKVYGRHNSSGDKEVIIYKSGDDGWDESTFKYSVHAGKTFSYNDLAGGCTWSFPNNSQAADNEYQWQIPRFYFAIPCAYEYEITGDETIAQGLLDIMLDFAKDKGSNVGPFPRSLDAGERMENWIYAYSKLVNSPSMDATDNVDILKSLYKMGAYMATDTAYHNDGNWGVFETSTFIKMGISFPEFKESAGWITLAKNRFDELINLLIKSDGSYRESTASYTFGIGQRFIGFLEVDEAAGINFSDAFKDKVHKLGNYLINLVFPDGDEVNWGDGGSYPERGLLLRFANYYNDEGFRYVATGGAEGTPPSYNSTEFPNNNIMILRSGWSEQDLLLWTAASTSNYHKHPDDNGLMLYGYGKKLLVDVGAFTYASEPVSNELRFTTKSHNTIEVDGQRQVSGGGRRDFYTSSYMDYSILTATPKSGVTHVRNIFFVKPSYYVVMDSLQSNNGSHTYRANWHTAPQLEIAAGNNSLLTTAPGQEATVSVLSADNVDVSLHDGYYSSKFYLVDNARYGRFTKTGSGNITFNTLLYPENGPSNDDIAIERIAVTGAGENAAATKVTVDGDDSYIYVSHDGQVGERTAGDFTFTGKIANVRKKSGAYAGYYFNRGRIIKEGNQGLVVSPKTVEDFMVDFADGTTMNIEAAGIVTTTSSVGAIKIYAPDTITQVNFNGEQVEFVRDGDYILAVGFLLDTNEYVDVQVKGDAYVRGGTYAGDNYGAATNLTVKNDNINYTRKAYFEFNDLPAGQQAILNLHVASLGSSSPTINIYRVDGGAFDEGTLNWNNQPTQGDLLGSLNITESDKWYTLDVSAAIGSGAVQDFGIMVESTTSGSEAWFSFSSKEGSNGAYVRRNIEDPNQPTVLFEDNFDDNQLSGWGTYEGTWSEANGNLAVLSHSGAKVVASAIDFENFTYEVDLSVGATGNGGVIFRVTNPSNGTDAYSGYYAGLNAGTNKIELGKANNGWSFIEQADFSITPGTSYHMKVVVEDQQIRVYVEDMETAKIDVTDSSHTSGSIGLRTYKTNVTFDNVKVTK